jgi:hypothetical protein
MEKPRSYTVISPEAGSFDDLQANSRLAHQARARFIKGVKADVDRFLETSRRVDLKMKEKYPDWHDPKPVEPEFYKAMIREAIVDRQGLTPGRKYKLDLVDRLDPEQKLAIYEKPLARMGEIVASVGVSIPTGLIDRVRVIDQESFWALLLWQDGENDYDQYGTVGFSLRNRLCVINEGAIQEQVEERGESFDDIVRNVGTHELWHSLSYKEDWNIPESRIRYGKSIGAQVVKRSGIVSKSRKNRSLNEQHLALISLDEGLANIVTHQSLVPDGFKVIDITHEGENEAVEQLKNIVGIEPMLRATLTKEGLREFIEIVDGIYGRGAVRRLCEALQIDRGARGLASMMGETVAFQTTKNFLETGQVIIPDTD